MTHQSDTDPIGWAKIAYTRQRHRIPPHESDDAFSDACYGVAKAMTTWREGRGSTLRTWCIRHAEHAIIDGFRTRHGRKRTITITPTDEVPDTATADPWSTVDAALTTTPLLHTLTDTQRHDVVAHLLADLPLATIAQQRGVTEAAISYSVKRALTTLKATA